MSMGSRRSYGSYNDGRAAAHALDLIGERWMMIVVRELLSGLKRFTDIQQDVIGIGPAVLTLRLHDLKNSRIGYRRRLPAPGRIEVYEFTKWYGSRLRLSVSRRFKWRFVRPRFIGAISKSHLTASGVGTQMHRLD